jgi:hypothetical protein
MNSEEAELLLARALPPPARTGRWRRSFTAHQRRELARLDVTTEQEGRLQRILPAIAFFTTQGPKLADVRAHLMQVRKDAHAAAQALRTLLEGRDDTREEGRIRIFQAIEALHPERCEVDPTQVSVWARYNHREPEAWRMLEALQALEAVAKNAVARMPKSQTRPIAHPYPVSLIKAAMTVPDAPAFRVSASPGTPFRDVVATCYAAAGAANTDPLRAIRAYLREHNASPKN